jgi:protein TonB
VTSSTQSDNAISSTTEAAEEAIDRPDPVVREAPPPPPPPKKKKTMTKSKMKKRKKAVKTRPRLMRGCRLPRYPRRSEEKGEEGTVVLRFLVGADGTVKSSQLVRSSGYARLDNAARTAFSRCKFRPGTVDGVRVESWVSQPFTWRLR